MHNIAFEADAATLPRHFVALFRAGAAQLKRYGAYLRD